MRRMYGAALCRLIELKLRSLVNRVKMAELEMYIKNECPDIIGLTETWASDKISNEELKLVGYDMFRKDREIESIDKHKGGGVLLYVKHKWNAVQREDLNNENFKESIWCEIGQKNGKLLIGVCYRTPNANEEVDKGLYELITRSNKESVIIMGDFNFHVNWNTLEGETRKDRQFMQVIEDEFLSQLIKEPTRGGNTLDLLLTSDKDLIDNLTVGECFGTSDHQIVRWELVINDVRQSCTDIIG